MALKKEALPRLQAFAPQFVFISAGFDAHVNDPLAHMNVTREGYREMGQLVLDLAQETAEGRLVTVLEGGYNLEVLEECVEDHRQAADGHTVRPFLRAEGQYYRHDYLLPGPAAKAPGPHLRAAGDFAAGGGPG